MVEFEVSPWGKSFSLWKERNPYIPPLIKTCFALSPSYDFAFDGAFVN